MITLITIFGLVGLAFLAVKAEPIILIKRALGFKEEDYSNYKPFKQFIHRLIYCEYCLSVWITFFFTFDIYMMGLVSLLTCLISRFIL